ncbi:hypothetical protein [Saccharothrix stipae]
MRAAGHDVRVAARPDLADAIVQAGLTAVPVGNALDLAELSRWPGAGSASPSACPGATCGA